MNKKDKSLGMFLIVLLIGVILALDIHASIRIVYPPKIPLSDFHAEWGPKKSLAEYGINNYQDVAFRYDPSSPLLSGWFIPGRKNGIVAVITEGWAQNRNKALKYSVLFHELGYPVLTFDYRGQGASEGNSGTMGYLEQYDIAAAVNYLKGKKYNKIILFGVSMGGFSSLKYLETTGDKSIQAIILDSTYYSYDHVLYDWIKHNYQLPWVMIKTIYWFSGLFMQINPGDIVFRHLENISVPVLILQGGKDRDVTLRNARELHKHLKNNQLLIIPAAEHAELYSYNPPYYRQIIREFLDKTHL